MTEPVWDVVAKLNEAVAGINRVAELVRSGEVWLDPEEVGDAVKEIEEFKHEIQAMVREARDLGEPMRLGDNPVATPMAQKFAQRAIGGPTSWQSVLQKYWDVLDTCQANINGGVQNYRNNEAHNAAKFRGERG